MPEPGYHSRPGSEIVLDLELSLVTVTAGRVVGHIDHSKARIYFQSPDSLHATWLAGTGLCQHWADGGCGEFAIFKPKPPR